MSKNKGEVMSKRGEDERLAPLREKARRGELEKEDVALAVRVLRGDRWEAMTLGAVKGAKGKGKKKVKGEEEKNDEHERQG